MKGADPKAEDFLDGFYLYQHKVTDEGFLYHFYKHMWLSTVKHKEMNTLPEHFTCSRMFQCKSWS